MGRVPCCEKMGLKKGPWTPEEDHILVSYIQRYGHSNWRALPKQAGLLRCGKSCRLRWINYLRPDIKRGNFSDEEEETIIKLHQILGNRWSAIAANLPGRTDNEIKNYWHTHIKKKLQENFSTTSTSSSSSGHQNHCTRGAIDDNNARFSDPVNFCTHQRKDQDSELAPVNFQVEPSQELLSSSTVTMEPDVNGFGAINDTEFWYDLLMKTGNSRDVHGN